MTREEAIAIFIRERDEDIFVRTGYRERIHEALSMGIKALEQKSSEDAISRQVVLEIQAKYAEHMGATKFWQMRDEIKALPPVTPHYTDVEIQKKQEMEQAEIQKAYELGQESQPNIGRWIFIRMIPTKFYNEYECSECGRRIRCTERQLVNYPYCHCGTKMEK